MRLLIVTPRLLYPADSGGKIRSSKLFEKLARAHDITIVCFRTPADTDEQVRGMAACCSRLETIQWNESVKFSPRFYAEVATNLLSIHAYAFQKYYDRRMVSLVRSLLLTSRFDLLVCDFLHLSLNVVALPFSPKILFQHNVESLVRRRHFELIRNPIARAYLFWEWWRLRRNERWAAKQFDHCVLVSDQDRRLMAELYGVTHTSTIPAAVDADYFRTLNTPCDEAHLVFTGSFDWFPNEDAACYFVREILPRVQRERAVTFWIVGRNPSSVIRDLARSCPNVRVTGTVADVRPYIDRACVYVVPLRIGGGTRIKIFEAMAMAKAIVSTPVGAEGLPVLHDENILLAESPDQFAERVLALIRDAPLRRRLGEAARALVSERFTWDIAARRFDDICTSVVARAPLGA